jgi:chorismate dehydratase
VELVKDTPDRLSDALVAGDLDLGPISVAEYLNHPEDLLVLPGLAVGSDGPVLSVVLASRCPLADITRVALGSTSRTSVLLARMLLEQRYGLRPEYESMPPDLTTMLLDADAAVLIGDAALRAAHAASRLRLHVYDLGQQWRSWAGVPMVFAVWAVRRVVMERRPGEVKDVHAAFVRSLDMALQEIDCIADEAARWEPFSAAELARYFRTLDFRLDAAQQAGLAEFARRAAAFGGAPLLRNVTFAPL